MYANILTFLILSLAFNSKSGGLNEGMPEGWVRTQAPAGKIATNNTILCANFSNFKWQFEVQSGQVRILDSSKEPARVDFLPRYVRTKEMVGRARVLRAGDGWLLGFNAGEFGGGLWWLSADGNTTKHLTRENVQAMVVRGKEILVLTGLAHLGMDRGTIYSYLPGDDASPLVLITDLGSAPAAATVLEDGSLLIAAHRRILRLSTDNRLQELYQNENVGIYYPRSIAMDPKGNIFVGTTFYVLQLQPHSEGPYDAAWFMPAACKKIKIKNSECICVGSSRGSQEQ